MNIVFWISALMMMIILVMSIFCTTMIGQNAANWGPDMPDIEDHWGKVGMSCLTLFQFLTLDDWSNITRQVVWPSTDQSPFMTLLLLTMFLSYVVFAAFVILSLLTGVMAEHMNTVRQQEEADETGTASRT